jgi:4,5-dihydroxyphthalate decarboxylase
MWRSRCSCRAPSAIRESRTDRGINVPADLKGKRIGIPEYQQTAILWIRGMLRDEHGIGVEDIEWLTGGVNEPLPGERIPITLPPRIRVTSIGSQRRSTSC